MGEGGGGGRGQEDFSREKNPGPNFEKKSLQDRKSSTIRFVLFANKKTFWESDLDKSNRLLSGSQFVNSLYCIVLN